jgi:endonuclease/exonuclease/phosphatase family metal-dependent hydrolase
MRLLRVLAAVASCIVSMAACADLADGGSAAADAQEEPVGEAASELTTGGRICSWNIRRLGHGFDAQPKDLAVVAKIITRNCDVVAAQEVMETGGVANGHADLLAKLGSRWDGVITDSAQPNDPIASSSEHYAFYFRKSAASICPNWSPSTGVRQLNDPEGTFQREPAWTCLKVKGHPRELLLLSYHAIFGSMVERRREVGALDDDLNNDGRKDDFLRAVKASRTGSPDILMVGDFNLEGSDIVGELPTWKDLTTGNGSTLNLDDGISPNMYDHLVVPPGQPQLDGLEKAKVLDVRDQAPSGDTFYRRVSDHLPIRFSLRSLQP